jgi:PTS system mannose-specific IIA component
MTAVGAAVRPGLLILTHGGLAGEFLRALETIVGPVADARALSIGWDSDPAVAREAVRAALEAVDRGAGALILTDMFGGTPTNLALAFHGERATIVTGVNLPMLIRWASMPAGSLRDVAERVRDQGRNSITLADDFLRARPGGGDA